MNLSTPVKFLIGLVIALVVGWLFHGPLGYGQGFIDEVEVAAQTTVRNAEIPGVQLRMQREPLARKATLSGPATPFQREGIGSLPGLDEQLLAVPGMSRIEWTNPPQ